jgi:hypothetical protein
MNAPLDIDIALGKRGIRGGGIRDLLRDRARCARNQRGARDRTGPQEARPVSVMFVGHVSLR